MMPQIYPDWWRKHFLRVELWIALFAGACIAIWATKFHGSTFLMRLVVHNRGQIYGTMASISGSLLGFVITAMSIVLGFSSSERLTLLKKSDHYPQLWAVFTSTIKWLGATTILWLVALVLDTDSSPKPMLLIACVTATIIAALRLIRCSWVLERIVEVLTA